MRDREQKGDGDTGLLQMVQTGMSGVSAQLGAQLGREAGHVLQVEVAGFPDGLGMCV